MRRSPKMLIRAFSNEHLRWALSIFTSRKSLPFHMGGRPGRRPSEASQSMPYHRRRKPWDLGFLDAWQSKRCVSLTHRNELANSGNVRGTWHTQGGGTEKTPQKCAARKQH